LCGGISINDLYRSFKNEIPKSPLWGYWGFRGNGDIVLMAIYRQTVLLLKI
jgi:hypothetical protein